MVCRRVDRISECGREQCAAIERERQALFDQKEDWAQAEADYAGLNTKPQLERLLKQHHDFGEDLIDIVAENLLCD
jgi:hypothetical protein